MTSPWLPLRRFPHQTSSNFAYCPTDSNKMKEKHWIPSSKLTLSHKQIPAGQANACFAYFIPSSQLIAINGKGKHLSIKNPRRILLSCSSVIHSVSVSSSSIIIIIIIQFFAHSLTLKHRDPGKHGNKSRQTTRQFCVRGKGVRVLAEPDHVEETGHSNPFCFGRNKDKGERKKEVFCVNEDAFPSFPRALPRSSSWLGNHLPVKFELLFLLPFFIFFSWGLVVRGRIQTPWFLQRVPLQFPFSIAQTLIPPLSLSLSFSSAPILRLYQTFYI